MSDKPLRSECGKYLIGPYDASAPSSMTGRSLILNGIEVGLTSWWSRCPSPANRVRFETGCGEHRATFSYPRWPSWFRRRWVSCFDITCTELAELVEANGGKVLTCWKADMNCWNQVGFKASAEVTAKIDAALTNLGVGGTVRPRSRGNGKSSVHGRKDMPDTYRPLRDDDPVGTEVYEETISEQWGHLGFIRARYTGRSWVETANGLATWHDAHLRVREPWGELLEAAKRLTAQCVGTKECLAVINAIAAVEAQKGGA